MIVFQILMKYKPMGSETKQSSLLNCQIHGFFVLHVPAAAPTARIIFRSRQPLRT